MAIIGRRLRSIFGLFYIVDVVLARKNDGLTYEQLISKFNISCRNALIHCLSRTCMIEYWDHGMPGQGISYLNSYDEELFLQIIKNSAIVQYIISIQVLENLA